MDSARRQWGETPWSTPDATYTAARPASAQIDVAIIGGGLTGASTAYHLAKRGIGATVFEAGDIGDGASGRTGSYHLPF
jgi:glycerol-3-phosphate dehydrogenase